MRAPAHPEQALPTVHIKPNFRRLENRVYLFIRKERRVVHRVTLTGTPFGNCLQFVCNGRDLERISNLDAVWAAIYRLLKGFALEAAKLLDLAQYLQ